MTIALSAVRPLATKAPTARQLYGALMTDPLAQQSRQASRDFLKSQLQQAAHLPCDMPAQPDLLENWMQQAALDAGAEYAHYLDSRKAGRPRRYFSSRSHALSFLQRVEPTKLVDGAWLYGVLQHWPDDRFYPLIRTYLEELGDGDPDQNHVALYKRLLTRYGCDTAPELSDEHYLQGALQLSLGYNADQFMPEIIGYNLGYEVLPLHLLITAFELDELGIDPYYFTLHVTVDNASTGHAQKAVKTVLNALPTDGDPDPFLERVANGYRLNDLGLGTTGVIGSFDLEQELVRVLERKSTFGKFVHSDFCSIGGRTVNEWLAKPEQVRGFLQVLEEQRWIKRHQDPKNSRFWRLVEGSKAPMFGVFSPFEKQLLHDWIAGDWLDDGAGLHGSQTSATGGRKPKHLRRHQAPGAPQETSKAPQKVQLGNIDGYADQAIWDLERELEQLPEGMRMARLIKLMAPSSHATTTGLLATRHFAAALG